MPTTTFEKHVWAEIDLDALRANFRAVKERAGGLPLCAVVKADSYGHGAVQCSRVFAEEGAAWLAVSCLTEALQLRNAGRTLPILILGHVEPEYTSALIKKHITAACYSLPQAKALSAAAERAGGTVDIHLKADTGMGRIGFALRTDFDAALAGMLEGVGVYQDRDKYLLRSLQTTGRMERLIGEMLSISRMESGSAAVRQDPVDLSALMAQQLALDRELLEQRGQQLVSALTPGITVPADASLLGKAVGNLLSNASRYSPEGAEIRVWCGRLEGRPALSVENTGARISGDALPHLFEAFYREEGSRNRSTGGSGLGLYLVKMILDRHGAVCTIENTEEGGKATVRF